MRRKGFWMTRAAGGAVAGVLLAGAGVGVAVAGASGTSDQYTPGAKPYAGVQPHNVTVGTQTFPSSVTTTIQPVTVTQPYAVANPTEAAVLEAAVTDLATDNNTILALLKGDLRTLLEPTGNNLKTATLAKAKRLSFAFVSPGSGTLSVVWKGGVKGKKSVNYVNYSTKLTKLGDITVKLPSTAAGRKLFTKAKNGTVAAVVTYTTATGAKLKVTRNYKLVG